MKLNDILRQMQTRLEGHSPSARMECELIACHVLQKTKAFLFSHPEFGIGKQELEAMQRLLFERKQGKPIAHILGRQGFWDFELRVTPDVLIPRPETECLVEKVLLLLPKDRACHIADLGTGSGAIAIALAKERPNWTVTAVDISTKALAVAQDNAKSLGVGNIQFLEGNWCDPLLLQKFDCIVANPPYIAESDPELEVNVRKYEPERALIAGKAGTECLQEIIEEAKKYLKPEAYLMVEHGNQQSEAVQALFRLQGYVNCVAGNDYSGHVRYAFGATGRQARVR